MYNKELVAKVKAEFVSRWYKIVKCSKDLFIISYTRNDDDHEAWLKTYCLEKDYSIYESMNPDCYKTTDEMWKDLHKETLKIWDIKDFYLPWDMVIIHNKTNGINRYKIETIIQTEYNSNYITYCCSKSSYIMSYEIIAAVNGRTSHEIAKQISILNSNKNK